MLGREDFLNFGDLSVLSVVSLAGIYLLAFCRFLWLASKAFFLVFCCFTVMPVINLLPFGPKLTLHCPLRDKGAGRCWRGRGGWDCALLPRRRQLSSRGPPVWPLAVKGFTGTLEGGPCVKHLWCVSVWTFYFILFFLILPGIHRAFWAWGLGVFITSVKFQLLCWMLHLCSLSGFSFCDVGFVRTSPICFNFLQKILINVSFTAIRPTHLKCTVR